MICACASRISRKICTAASRSSCGTSCSSHARSGVPAALSSFPILRSEASLDIRVLVDRSSAEFFVAGGRQNRAMRHYPAAGDVGASVRASGGPALHRSAVAHEMGCGWVAEQQ